MRDREGIVRYWYALELLQSQAAPKKMRRHDKFSPFIHDISADRPVMPWSVESDVQGQLLPPGCFWGHTLFGHLYDSRDVARKLEELFGAQQGYREPQQRESALFSVKFDADGLMLDDSLILSSEAWFLGRAIAGKDWSQGFEEDQRTIRGKANEILGGAVTAGNLRRLTKLIRAFFALEAFFGDLGERQHRFRSTPIRTTQPEQESDPLNSFLLSDLANVADSLTRKISSPALDRYLQQHATVDRIHLDGDESTEKVIELLSPSRYSSGCWPSDGHLGLVHSQQLAVNTILTTLTDGDGLLGVNGPPGTGKTTLLRDVIAAVVTQRADVLASLGKASEAFVTNGREVANDGGNKRAAHKITPKLYGFEIVIASSNNGAVENVTLELPQRDKIDGSWLAEVDYFSDLGELVTGKPAWGLISAALGSKGKRSDFVNSFFYGNRRAEKNAVDIPESEGMDATKTIDPTEAEDSDASDSSQASRASGSEESPDQENSKGFLGWLNAHDEMYPDTEARVKAWRIAVSEYATAKRDADQLRGGTAQVLSLFEAVAQSRRQVQRKEETLKDFDEKMLAVAAKLVELDVSKWEPARNEAARHSKALQNHQAAKPSVRESLLSLWSTKHDWVAKHKILSSTCAVADAEFEHVKRSIQRLEADQLALKKLSAEEKQELDQLRRHADGHSEKLRGIAEAYKAVHLLAWLDTGTLGRGEAIELAEPWIIKDWRQARAKVFIQALKLHRTFFQIEAKRIRSNLSFVTCMLTNGSYGGVSRDAIRSVWVSLFMVVPVLSSTFASFARSFGTLGAAEIGWLLVDEAGQANPQAAVGALWRSRRAVLVGDPLQLTPIMTVSDAVLEHMRTGYRVNEHWLPNRQSAQTLADQATPLGKMIGPAGDKKWVGLPLVVHRRCDRPMFDLANRIAYDGAMVYGTATPNSVKETKARLLTGWIHASGPSSGNWVEAEGVALKQLLALLKADGVADTDISVITPFQDVRKKLSLMLPKGMVYGTIHTMQGKEAPVVIMVLGGNSVSPSARDWAVSAPNLLNVAATRAKRRFYVIGDRSNWAGRSLFCDVMDLLPERDLPGPIPTGLT